MTEILDIAVEKAKVLSTRRRDEIGQVMIEMIEQDHSEMALSPAQQDEVRRRLAGPLELVAADEMNAFFRKLTG